jgi:hypothetical protein
LPSEIDEAVSAWMKRHGWEVQPARREQDPDMGFYVWQEQTPSIGRSHALWIAEPMLRRLGAEELLGIFKTEDVAEDIRINFKVRIEERGAEYRVSVVPRKSGEFRRLE